VLAKSGTRLSFSHSSVDLMRGIQLHDVVLSDSSGHPFLTAERIEAGVRLFPLFRRILDFHTLRL
jgi:uncharacterized protein involved in outer membrane biogenesis